DHAFCGAGDHRDQSAWGYDCGAAQSIYFGMVKGRNCAINRMAAAGGLQPLVEDSRRERQRAMATVGTGKYTYELIENWAKLPPGQTFGNTSAVATDAQDRVYVFQRKEPPVLVFDRDVT